MDYPKSLRWSRLLCFVGSVLWIAGCGSNGSSTPSIGDPSLVIFGGNITADAGQFVTINGTTGTILLVRTGQTVHVTVQLDQSATSPYASIASVNNHTPISWTKMNQVSGQPGSWTLNYTINSSAGSNPTGMFAVSVQANDAQGRAVSGPIGVFYFSAL